LRLPRGRWFGTTAIVDGYRPANLVWPGRTGFWGDRLNPDAPLSVEDADVGLTAVALPFGSRQQCLARLDEPAAYVHFPEPTFWISREAGPKIWIGVGLVGCPHLVERLSYFAFRTVSSLAEIDVTTVKPVAVDVPEICHGLHFWSGRLSVITEVQFHSRTLFKAGNKRTPSVRRNFHKAPVAFFVMEFFGGISSPVVNGMRRINAWPTR
jgi:hypothetical protein